MTTGSQAARLFPAARLLVVSSHFPPDRGAGTHRIVRFAALLQRGGWTVDVLTLRADAYRPGTPIDEGLLQRVPPGIAVIRTGRLTLFGARGGGRNRRVGRAADGAASQCTRANGLLRRLKTFVRDVSTTPDPEIGWLVPAIRAGLRHARRHRPDVVLSSAPPFTCHLVAAAIARRTGARWAADFRDPWSRAPWALEERTTSWKGVVHRNLEGYTIRHASAVLLNTERMTAEFAGHYGAAVAQRFHTLPNGFDRATIGLFVDRRPPADDVLTILHAGTLYRQRDPSGLIEALAELVAERRVDRARVRLEFMGSTASHFGLPGLVSTLGLQDCVIFTRPVPHHESLARVAEADVLLIVQPGTHLQVPAKLYEYLAFRRPLLAYAPEGAVADLVRGAGNGLVVHPGDRHGAREALQALYERRACLDELFAADDTFIARFEGDALVARLDTILRTLLDTGATAGAGPGVEPRGAP